MTSVDPNPVITLSDEPSYSAQEAAAMVGRSFSWIDQRVRAGDFVRPDGTVVVPLRTTGGYRRFTLTMLKDIAGCCYLKGWFSTDTLRSVYREILVAAHRDGGGTSSQDGDVPYLDIAVNMNAAGVPATIAELVVGPGPDQPSWIAPTRALLEERGHDPDVVVG